MKACILIPHYDHAEQFERILPRLLETGMPLVVVDDHSPNPAWTRLAELLARMAPDTPFNPTFLDESFELRYRSFAMINFAFIALSGIAVAIAAMGIFGMAMFVIRKRMREVGIRKTLGASVGRLLRLLLWDLAKPIVIANLIVWPVAYLGAKAYLAMFVNRMALTPAPFLTALAATLIFAGIAVANQVFRAARARPADVLQYE